MHILITNYGQNEIELLLINERCDVMCVLNIKDSLCCGKSPGLGKQMYSTRLTAKHCIFTPSCDFPYSHLPTPLGIRYTAHSTSPTFAPSLVPILTAIVPNYILGNEDYSQCSVLVHSTHSTIHLHHFISLKRMCWIFHPFPFHSKTKKRLWLPYWITF